MFRIVAITSAGLSLLGGSLAHAAPAAKKTAAEKPAAPAYQKAGREKPAPELFIAIGRQDTAEVKALLAGGVSPNVKNTLGMSALTFAAFTGNMEIIRTLIAHGAEVNPPSLFGTPLTTAAMAGSSEIMRLLIQKGADITAGRPDRISILMYAARTGDPELVRILIAKKADVAAADNHGSTALSYAARSGKFEAAKILLEAGAKVEVPDMDGWTPMMHAAVNGHASIVELLLRKGANPKAVDRRGRTALLLAASYGDHPEVARALLAAGADAAAKDAKGRTALALADTRGYEATASVLREKAGAAPASAPAPLRTPREAAEVSLRQVEQSMQTFAKRTGCTSCHHEGISRATTGFALAHGFKIDKAFAKEQEKRVVGAFEQMRPLLEKAVQDSAQIKNVPIVDIDDLAPTNGTLMLGLAAHGTPRSETLGLAAMVLARSQRPDGEWSFTFQREPVQSSIFSTTAMSIRALQTYAPEQYAAEVRERIARAKQWLLATPARNTEDRVFRLLGLKLAGATTDERAKALEELRAAQRKDGGWAQLEGLHSDAYATGTALFALNQGGEIPVTDPVYQRGVKFLLRTQEDDGTWYVSKRAMPANNYFDTGFPYGQSQYISHQAASWATMALILAADAPPAQQQAAR